MKFKTSSGLRAAWCGLAAGLLLAGAAHAAYPDRPMRW